MESDAHVPISTRGKTSDGERRGARGHAVLAASTVDVCSRSKRPTARSQLGKRCCSPHPTQWKCDAPAGLEAPDLRRPVVRGREHPNPSNGGRMVERTRVPMEGYEGMTRQHTDTTQATILGLGEHRCDALWFWRSELHMPMCPTASLTGRRATMRVFVANRWQVGGERP